MGMGADMLRNIHEEGYAAGLLFEWADEWFKFTWNTIDLELPSDRRQLWRNNLTNEEHFGVIASEPGSKPVVVLDGDDAEWATNGSLVIAESRGAVREVRAVKDEQYFYLRLRLDQEESWREAPITAGLDVREGGNRGLPDRPGVFAEADVALVVGPEEAELLQAAWWEPTRIRYGLGRKYMDVDPEDMKPGSGAWVPPTQILNRPQVDRPAEFHELGSYTVEADPGAVSDQRILIAAAGPVVEVRLPWALLGFSDPSSRKLFVEHPEAATSTEDALPIRVAVVAGDEPVLITAPYSWDPWHEITWHERRKAGSDELARAMRDVSAPPG
jgi:hypothetical protein